MAFLMVPVNVEILMHVTENIARVASAYSTPSGCRFVSVV